MGIFSPIGDPHEEQGRRLDDAAALDQPPGGRTPKRPGGVTQRQGGELVTADRPSHQAGDEGEFLLVDLSSPARRLQIGHPF